MAQRLQQATELLSQQDDDWAKLISLVGDCTFSTSLEREPYVALVRAVAHQQLHTKAGGAIFNKLIAHFGYFPEPQALFTAEFDGLRACGFSGRKIETLKGIASATMAGVVPSRADAESMTDEALISQLVTLKGIGQWTVEMMLMHTLGRMDILPVDDFGVVHGYRRLKSLELAPTRKDMLEIGKAWRPFRTIASWYLWRVPKE
ncbi:MAG: DNA-3-methyladenine glycosylase [Methylophilaceae bacterium]